MATKLKLEKNGVIADSVQEAVNGTKRILKRASQNPEKVDALLAGMLTDIVKATEKVVEQSREVNNITPA